MKIRINKMITCNNKIQIHNNNNQASNKVVIKIQNKMKEKLNKIKIVKIKSKISKHCKIMKPLKIKVRQEETLKTIINKNLLIIKNRVNHPQINKNMNKKVLYKNLKILKRNKIVSKVMDKILKILHNRLQKNNKIKILKLKQKMKKKVKFYQLKMSKIQKEEKIIREDKQRKKLQWLRKIKMMTIQSKM